MPDRDRNRVPDHRSDVLKGSLSQISLSVQLLQSIINSQLESLQLCYGSFSQLESLQLCYGSFSQLESLQLCYGSFSQLESLQFVSKEHSF